MGMIVLNKPIQHPARAQGDGALWINRDLNASSIFGCIFFVAAIWVFNRFWNEGTFLLK